MAWQESLRHPLWVSRNRVYALLLRSEMVSASEADVVPHYLGLRFAQWEAGAVAVVAVAAEAAVTMVVVMVYLAGPENEASIPAENPFSRL